MTYLPQPLTALRGLSYVGYYQDRDQAMNAISHVVEAVASLERIVLGTATFFVIRYATYKFPSTGYCSFLLGVTLVAIRQFSGFACNIGMGTYNIYKAVRFIQYLQNKNPMPWTKIAIATCDIVLGYIILCCPPRGSFNFIDGKGHLIDRIANWTANKLVQHLPAK